MPITTLTLPDGPEIDVPHADIIGQRPEGSLTRVYFRGGRSLLVKPLPDIGSVTRLR